MAKKSKREFKVVRVTYNPTPGWENRLSEAISIIMQSRSKAVDKCKTGKP